MASMQRVVSVVAAYLLIAASGFAQTSLADLDGHWRGFYTYSTQNLPGVEFDMTFQVRGDTCRGRIVEPNTFGDRSTSMLYANVECQLIVGKMPTRLVFKKVYDGTGGQSHAVDYEGDLSADRRTVTGSWRTGTQNGRFTLTRR